jgi:FlaA1/EpsC-like NDP-sugar epimerase
MPIDKIINPLLNLPRMTKRLLALVVDSALCVFCVWFAYYLRLDTWVALTGVHFYPVVASLLIALPLFVSQGLYRAIFRYAGWSAFMAVARAVGIYALLYMCVFTVVSVPGVPRTIGILQPLLLLVAVGMSRIVTRAVLGGAYRDRLNLNILPRVLIYGAGSSGRQLAAGLSGSREVNVVGFLDDDKRLHGSILSGLTIYDPQELSDLAISLEIAFVLLALPSASRADRNRILDRIRLAKVTVRSMPELSDIAQGHVSVSDLRELDIDDLLGREKIDPDQALLDRAISHKTVMVTGAGGSIGSELCRQVLANRPDCLVLVDQSEYALYAIHSELVKATVSMSLGAVSIVPYLASTRDLDRMKQVMRESRPDTVYHAAAYKHVPLVENNPVEGIRNNTFGTLTTAMAALETGVENFVLISTDKAVRPTNIMGASKRLAELVLQALAADVSQKAKATKFSMVRFGNVLGSSGSVVPLFRQQIRDGGPITLTHADITRYFMTIPEASQLVVQASAMALGGEVFVLNMGEPVKILDLARRMVELSGLHIRDEDNPGGDIAIEITGLRPGEKLYEELLIGDNPEPTAHKLILKAHEDFLPLHELQQQLAILEKAMDRNDIDAIKTELQVLVSGYSPALDSELNLSNAC